MTDLARPTAAPGRPRSEQARRAVMAAAHAQYEEHGYAATTIEAIAARSGVAKTTIYRWWPHRAALLVDVLVEVSSTEVPIPEGRDPMKAMAAELRWIAGAMNGSLGRLLTALLGDAQQDPQVRTALVQRLFQPRSEASSSNISRAQAAGALRPDVPPHVALDLLVGPLFYRAFVQHQPLTDAFVKQLLRYAVEGLKVQRPPSRRRKTL